MVDFTKTARTLQSSATNTAGSTATGSAVDLTGAMGMLVTALITNGATGPTVACSFRLEVSNDNSVWRELCTFTAGTANNGTYPFAVRVPPEAMYVRSVFTGNTGQSVTVEALGHEISELE